jgi:hypothetical protein
MKPSPFVADVIILAATAARAPIFCGVLRRDPQRRDEQGGASALIAFLTAPAARAALKKHGLDPG